MLEMVKWQNLVVGLSLAVVITLIVAQLASRVTAWLFEEGLRIALIGVLAYFTVRISALGIGHLEQAVPRGLRQASARSSSTDFTLLAV